MTKEELGNFVLEHLKSISNALKQCPEANDHVVSIAVWKDYVSAFQLTDDGKDYVFSVFEGGLNNDLSDQ